MYLREETYKREPEGRRARRKEKVEGETTVNGESVRTPDSSLTHSTSTPPLRFRSSKGTVLVSTGTVARYSVFDDSVPSPFNRFPDPSSNLSKPILLCPVNLGVIQRAVLIGCKVSSE